MNMTRATNIRTPARFGGLALAVLLVWAAAASCTDASAPSEERSNAACTDRLDNDGDGRVDCDDPDCRDADACGSATDSGALDRGPGTDGPGEDMNKGRPDRGPWADRSTTADTTAPDQAQPDALASRKEKEPNDGSTATEVDAVAFPQVVLGSIGKAADRDIFELALSAGDRLSVRVKAGGPLQAHLAVFDPAGKLPTAVSTGPGNNAFLEYYMLKSAKLLVAVRDRRNVGSSPQNVGGNTFTYTLSLLRLTRAPVQATVGGEAKGSLAPLGTVRVFAFSPQANATLEVRAVAQALTPPSDVDTRLSLFHPGQKAWLGTNDDASVSTKDSLLQGKMPFAGTYHAIVENVAAAPTKLDVKLRITTK